MSHAATFYEILGVTPAAPISEIKRAHRKLAQQNHPDKLHHLAADFPWVVQEATERFKQITEAFNVLSNEDARSRYDAEINRPQTGFHPRPAPSTYAQRRKQPPSYSGSDKADDIHTRAAETSDHAHEPFRRYTVSNDSPFHAAEPRAPRRRKNTFLSGIAFVGMVTLAFAAFNNGTLAKELHSLQLEADSSAPVAPSKSAFQQRNSTVGPSNTTPDVGYQFADIRYLRTLFNAYLIAQDVPTANVTHQKEFALLRHWDPSYYQSKFIVISWEYPNDNETQIGILFLDRPDTVFEATVTKQPGAARELQSLTPLEYTPQQMASIRSYWSQSLADRPHAL
jgi:curved DNA-binding protein CbpA